VQTEAFENLCRWAGDFGIELSGDQVALLKRYVSELLSWQGKINLTGLRSKDRILRELLLDSLFPLPHLPLTGRMLDMGSGAGFPAIPLKICLPQVTFHLLEPIGKKAAFLGQVIRMLGLRDIRVFRVRIEESGGLILPGYYDAVTTRAAAALPRLIEWCAPYLREEGLLVSFQGSFWKARVERCSEIMARHHLALSRSLPYKLPGENRERAVLFMKKKEGYTCPSSSASIAEYPSTVSPPSSKKSHFFKISTMAWSCRSMYLSRVKRFLKCHPLRIHMWAIMIMS